MLYINYLFIYSVFGFLLESTIYKIGNYNKHSSIFYGPYTLVYGFGVLLSILVYEYLEKRIRNMNKFLKIIFYFIVFTILLSLIEYIGGNILNFIFDIDMWDYSNHKYHFGKYICLTNSIIWGVLGTINIYFIYPNLKKVIKKIPNLYTIIIVFIFLIDLIMTLITKTNYFNSRKLIFSIFLFFSYT